MPSSDTQFQAGRSGNPAGRPKGSRSARDAFRRVLAQPDPTAPERTTLDAWAAEIVNGATTVGDRLAVLKWLEGASPPAGAGEPQTTLADVARRMAEKFPRINIPGVARAASASEREAISGDET
ncbi:DUF5681 domain-containing protein [Planctomyces sp. SH-PL62]|uniref:DUF5681 domain-containing protein n=1 Tax=Planctomyces sp. SH-PL62 TaxID=1636152 RepID=UPI00078D74FE|nr:DUF5681 domain-containing protein [Planctomyces sp. SH-PL62]AMV40458.1 hypothetical protein VT85_23715 [Planctomyces sp. SH-PL62]